jgi:hypothetical protein
LVSDRPFLFTLFSGDPVMKSTFLKCFAVLVLLAGCLPVHAADLESDSAPPTPDFAAMDQDVLVVMCQQLWARVQTLEGEVAQLKSRIGAEAGAVGGGGAVNDDLVAVAEGSWTVKIVSNPEPDVSQLQSRIAVEQAKITGNPQPGSTVTNINSRLDKARANLAETLAKKSGYEDSDGHWRPTRGYTDAELAACKRNIATIETEKRVAEQNIRQAEEQIRKLQSTRDLMAVDDAGLPVTIFARGISYQLATTLQEGQRYIITGRGSFTPAGGKVYLKTATPAPTPAPGSPGTPGSVAAPGRMDTEAAQPAAATAAPVDPFAEE